MITEIILHAVPMTVNCVALTSPRRWKDDTDIATPIIHDSTMKAVQGIGWLATASFATEYSELNTAYTKAGMQAKVLVQKDLDQADSSALSTTCLMYT